MKLFLTIALYMIVPVFVGIYTVNFGRWVGRRGNARGAWGLYVLAVLTVAIPLAILIVRAPG